MVEDAVLIGMFEEGQLYSPVTHDEGGEVTVHLSEDHPGAGDPDYRDRRNEIAALALAWEPGTAAPHVVYTDAEQEVWRTVCRELAPKHERLAIRESWRPRSGSAYRATVSRAWIWSAIGYVL
jgi:Biopterin-dependent aromatic amino acid hydroxylase